jgi:hypothetical protein
LTGNRTAVDAAPGADGALKKIFLAKEVNTGMEQPGTAAQPQPAFEGWDEALPAFTANFRDERAREAFEAKLRGASYLVPVDGDGAPRPFADAAGNVYMPAFTETREMLKLFGPETNSVAKPFLSLCDMVKGSPFLGVNINAKGKSFVMPLGMLEQMRLDAAGERNDENDVFTFHPFSGCPPALADGLAAALEQCGGVREAYLLETRTIYDKSSGGVLLVIDFDGAENLVFPSAAAVMSRHLKNGGFHISKADADLLRNLRRIAKPVYKRKREQQSE